jgi:hypothetical protein
MVCAWAHLLLLERVDHARLANIGVADKANGDVLLVGVQLGEPGEKVVSSSSRC